MLREAQFPVVVLAQFQAPDCPGQRGSPAELA